MTRDEVLTRLRADLPMLRGSFGVRSLSVFGSVARNEATSASDADILVEYEADRIVGMFDFIRLQIRLEHLLGCAVDLVTADALRQSHRQQVLREAVRAA